MWHCRKKSKCHCPPRQLPVQTAAGSAFNSGVFNTDADRELAAAGKNNSMTPFYVCFPITPLNPLLALVTVHCRNIQASQKLRALAVCPHSFWDHLTFTSLPLTEFLSLGRRARAFAAQGGASSTQSLDFCLGPPWNWTFGTKIFLKSCPKVWYTKSQREHTGRLHMAETEAICWSSQTTQCQGHYSFHWQAAGCLQLCNKLRGIIPLHFCYQ